jgi:RNA polymerase sigma-70 factor (ECF subfamily)
VSTVERSKADDDPELWRHRSVFQKLYAEDWRDLCAFLRARFGPGPPDPEDVAQQAFLTLGERPAERAHESPRGFVFRVAINLVLDAKRRQGRSARALAGSVAVLEPESAPDVERTLIARQELDLLKQVVAGMPPRHRLYLAANRFDGLSFAEIARQNGVSESLVRKTINEAVAACHRALAGGTIDHRGLSRERHRRS